MPRRRAVVPRGYYCTRTGKVSPFSRGRDSEMSFLPLSRRWHRADTIGVFVSRKIPKSMLHEDRPGGEGDDGLSVVLPSRFRPFLATTAVHICSCPVYNTQVHPLHVVNGNETATVSDPFG